MGLPPLKIIATNVGHGVIAYSIDKFAVEVYAMLIESSSEIWDLVSVATAEKSMRTTYEPAFGMLVGLMGFI